MLSRRLLSVSLGSAPIKLVKSSLSQDGSSFVHSSRCYSKGQSQLEIRSRTGLSASPLAKQLSETAKVEVTDANGNPLEVRPLKHFAHMQHLLPDWLKSGIQQTGYAAPMPVQAFAIPLLMENWDVVGLAPTGTGKTVAFAVPSMATMKLDPPPFAERGIAYPSTLVMCPTRELCQQTAVVFHVLGCKTCRVAEAYGGSPRREQAREVSYGCNVLVATPGRLLDFLDAGIVSLKNLDFLVLDEADRMLDMGFRGDLDRVQAFLDPQRDRRTMMWSATWPREVQHVASSYLKPSHVKIKAGDPRQGNKNIEQKFYAVKDLSKMNELVDLVQGIYNQHQKVIVFVARKADIEQIGEELYHRGGIDGRQVRTLHGDLRQERRDQVILGFKNSQFSILLATQVAGRGLDIPDLEHVINYDVPVDIDEYIHRIGRTGRAGRKGTAHTFLSMDTSESKRFVNDLLPYLKENDIPVSEEVHQASQALRNVNERRGGRGGGRGGGSRGRREGGRGAGPRFGADGYNRGGGYGGGYGGGGSGNQSFGGGW